VQCIYDILNLIIQIPFNSLELKTTCVRIIKESARFIKNDKELVKKLFAFLLQNFEIPYIKYKVFQAFSKLCIHNPQIVLENIAEFLISHLNYFLLTFLFIFDSPLIIIILNNFFFFLVYQKNFKEDLIIEGITQAIGSCEDNVMFGNLLSQICQPFANILLELYENYEKSLIENKEKFNKVLFYKLSFVINLF